MNTKSILSYSVYVICYLIYIEFNLFHWFYIFSYPFYGVQFHPEKNLYEWVRDHNISHTANAIKASQYFANFFINECRQNSNGFTGIDEENRMLIYNFPPTFTGRNKSPFEQSYLFKSDVDYPDGSMNQNKEVILV